MIRDDDHWLKLSDAFYSAAIDGQGWYEALDDFTKATGSKTGQLVCFGPDASIPLNVVTDVDPAFNDEFVEMGGGNPNINHRLRAGMRIPVLKVLSEPDFAGYRTDPEHVDLLRRWDRPFTCLTPLERTDGLLVGLAVARTHRQGNISDGERAVFEAIAPHIRAAVRMQTALEGKGAALVADTLEALSTPAFVCDNAGLVKALTPAAEQLVGAAAGLTLRRGQLLASSPNPPLIVKAAIDATLYLRCRPRTPAIRTVVLRNEAGAPSLVLDVVALPFRQFEFTFTPRVLVIARGDQSGDARRAAVLRAACGLTAAEIDIALKLAAGRSPDAIAGTRGVSIGTVRSQIKAIMSKLGVKRQVELVAAVNRF